MFVRVLATGYLHISELFLRMGASRLEPGYTVYGIDSQSEAVYLIFDGQFERGIDVASLLITAHVQVLMVSSAVAEPVDQPGISVKIEDDWFVYGKETVEIAIIQTMWMFSVRLHLEQVNDIDEPNF